LSCTKLKYQSFCNEAAQVYTAIVEDSNLACGGTFKSPERMANTCSHSVRKLVECSSHEVY
jgi:hypothetical protein